MRRGWQCKPPSGCSSPGHEEDEVGKDDGGECDKVEESSVGEEGEVFVTLKSQTTLPLVNLVTSTVTSSACSAMSPSLKSLLYSNVTLSKTAPEQHLL